MALVTVGTAADDTLSGVVWPASDADVAAINALIKDDLTVGTPRAATSGIGGLINEGLLVIPNRGQVRLYPGDVVAVDATGGVILITAAAAAGGDWVIT